MIKIKSEKQKMKFCPNCKGKTRQINFIGKHSDVKLFESKCLCCGYEYIFRIRTNGKGYMRTGNLNKEDTMNIKEIYEMNFKIGYYEPIK